MMHEKNIIHTGRPIRDAEKAIIMLHGRGADAFSMISLKDHLQINDFSILAPQATRRTWYPYSFLSAVKKNEPWLSSALELIDEVVADLISSGYSYQQIYFAGFSQGACLTLEYTARNPKRYGGIIAFTGGLIGDKIREHLYQGDFKQTPLFLGTSDPDSHVPLERAKASAILFEDMNANTYFQVYPNMGHIISSEELDTVNSIFFQIS